MSRQFIMSRGWSGTTTVKYFGLFGENSMSTVANIWYAESIISTPGRIGILYYGATAPGAGKNKIITMFKNGLATNLTVTATGTAIPTVVLDTVNYVTVAAGDDVSFKFDPDGNIYQNNEEKISVIFFPDTADQSIYGGSIAEALTTSTSATEYLQMYGFGLSLAVSANIERACFMVPTGGTIKNLYVELETAPGSGSSRTFTMMLNEVASSQTTTISNTATTGNDTSNNVTVAAGDRIQMRATTPGTSPTASRVRFGFTFEATNADEFIIPVCSSNEQIPVSTTYWYAVPSTMVHELSNSAALNYGRGGLDLLNMYIELTTAPGAGFPTKRRQFALWINDSPTGLNRTISLTATTGNRTSTVSLAQGDTINIRQLPTNSPALTYASLSMTAKMPASFSDGKMFLAKNV